MESSTILAIIFAINAAVLVVIKEVFKRPILADLIFGVGACIITVVAYLTHDTIAPIWILALLSIVILVQAWNAKKKADQAKK